MELLHPWIRSQKNHLTEFTRMTSSSACSVVSEKINTYVSRSKVSKEGRCKLRKRTRSENLRALQEFQKNLITNLHVSSDGVTPKGNRLFRKICTAAMLNSNLKTGMAYHLQHIPGPELSILWSIQTD